MSEHYAKVHLWAVGDDLYAIMRISSFQLGGMILTSDIHAKKDILYFRIQTTNSDIHKDLIAWCMVYYETFVKKGLSDELIDDLRNAVYMGQKEIQHRGFHNPIYDYHSHISPLIRRFNMA